MGALQVAIAVAEEAFAEGIAGIERPDNIEKYLEDRMWVPASQPPCAFVQPSRSLEPV